MSKSPRGKNRGVAPLRRSWNGSIWAIINKLGKCLIDRLVQVALLAGGEGWVYIHIEVQGGHDSQFAERMFTYNYRLYDRYRRPVASMAVLADDSPSWKPASFGYQLFGCRHLLEFPVVKLTGHADRLEHLLSQPNSFALVTAAHLLTKQTRGSNDLRFAAKWRLTKLLYERNWEKQHFIDLFSVIDWMMHLPSELEQQLWREITILERSKTMPYVTSVERIGIEKGIQQGIQQGMQRGESLLLLRQLVRRFGAATPLGGKPPDRSSACGAGGQGRGSAGRQDPGRGIYLNYRGAVDPGPATKMILPDSHIRLWWANE